MNKKYLKRSQDVNVFHCFVNALAMCLWKTLHTICCLTFPVSSISTPACKGRGNIAKLEIISSW